MAAGASWVTDVIKDEFLSFTPGKDSKLAPQSWLMKLLVKSDKTSWRKLQVPAEPVSDGDNLYLS